MPEPIDDLERVQTAVERLIQGVGPEQWTAPTPCTDWNVRDLVNHLTGGDTVFAAIARGQAGGIEEARALRAKLGDQLGDDPAAAYRSAATAVREAFSAPAFLEGTWPSPMGPQPGASLVVMRISEHLVHGWDLARATGQSPHLLPEDLAEQALKTNRQALDGRPREGGPFGPEQPAPADAPGIDRLAAFLGRPL